MESQFTNDQNSAKELKGNQINPINESEMKSNRKVKLEPINLKNSPSKQDQLTSTQRNSSRRDIEMQTNQSFNIKNEQLIDIVDNVQQRTFSEEVDIIEKLGGDEELMKLLQADKKQGINISTIQARIDQFGSNEKAKKRLKSLWEIFLGALDDFTLKILIVASIVSIEMIVSDHKEIAWIEGVAIMIAVMISSGITTVNDYQKQLQFANLSEISEARKMVTLVRNGEQLYLHQSKLLVGDIVIVDNGMEIPSDGILVESSEITADESAMTGETLPIVKNINSYCVQQRNQLIAEGNKDGASAHDVPSPLMLSGSKVLSGEGKMIVIAVGKFSAIGKIQNLLQSDEETATPLQQKLETIAEDIGKFGLVSAIFILLVLIIRLMITESNKDNGFGPEISGKIVDFVIIAITVIVVAIPEGLPLAVTLSLAFSIKKMLYDQNLVRQLSACETMGGANCICSDKTGTLTQNKMNVQQMWNNKKIDVDTYSDSLNLTSYVPKDLQQHFIQSIVMNSSANLYPEESGMATEIAMLKFIDKCGADIQGMRNKIQIVQKMPFSSSRKRMSTVIKDGDKNILYVKGASEIVLEGCNQLIGFNGQVQDMDKNLTDEIQKAIENMAVQSLRTIIIAQKEVSLSEDLDEKDDKGVFKVEKSGLKMVALVGIKDILRQEVPGAIAKCKAAGVRVRMVTGDNLITARAIAIECGIVNPDNLNSLVMNGADFIEQIGGVVCKNCQIKVCDCPITQDQALELGVPMRIDTIANGEVFDKLIDRIDVMSRSRPEDKYAMVVGLIERGNVVAVTGDGTNDAPALKKADVGFAMGIQGTQVARESCDIILLDDNFNSIVKAIMWGRNVYDCIKKFLQFQLTVNVVAVAITLVGSAIAQMAVLTAIQMLWVNLIMDTLASLALATEPPTMELLNRKPHSRTDYIVTKKMVKHIIGQSIFQMTILCIMLFMGETWIPESSDLLDDQIQTKINENKTYIDQKQTKNYSFSLKYSNSERNLVTSGRVTDYSTDLIVYIGPSRHFTFIFNTFVMLQIFNFLNARKLKDEWNTFEGISKSKIFAVIVVIIFILQLILLTFGGIALNCYQWSNASPYGGLNLTQWLISIGLGSLSLIVNILLKIVNEEQLCPETGNKEKDPAEGRGVLSLRSQSRSYTSRQ